MNESDIETEVVARLMREKSEGEGWRIATSLEDVPDEIGSYGIYDGLECRGGGVTYNLHASLQELTRSQSIRLRRAIYKWRPDVDGSDALWLEGKMRCERCHAIFGIDRMRSHMKGHL